jgi:hypothetical protein
MRTRSLACPVALALCASLAISSSPRAEVYLWTDEQGRVHMSDDLSQVPASQRERAEQAAQSAADKASRERFLDPNAPGVPLEVRTSADGAARRAADAPAKKGTGKQARTGKPRSGAGVRGRRHVLQIEKAGSEMRVVAELDGGVQVPFVLDTGAEICTLPAWALAELDITIDASTPRTSVVGVSGKPMTAPEVQIASVALGDAVVENVQMTVLDTMNIGLLGMPFFNHFKVSIDPTAGTLTLEEIDPAKLEESAVSGLNEQAWRQRFQQRIALLERARRRLEKIPTIYAASRERLEKQIEDLEAQLEELDDQADRAGVPPSWRE